MKISLIIPAYRPPQVLLSYIKKIAQQPFSKIFIVDDGSDEDHSALFKQISQIKKVRLLRHGVNLGKGAALKLALNEWYCSRPDDEAVVCLDADGQHLIKDVLKLTRNWQKTPHSLGLGTRTFRGKVPLRSKLGNLLTRFLFQFLVGKKLTDTQTGLRVIPRSFVPRLLKIKENGYEFELEMLIQTKYLGLPILEVPIRTVYLEGNQSSHFNPVLDSMRIYYVLFRSVMASLSTALLDNIVFITTLSFFVSPAYSQIAARVVTTIYSFFLIRSFVFHSRAEFAHSFMKYVLLTIVSGFISYGSILFLSQTMAMNIIVAKLLSETLIYLANFTIQRDFIFAKSSSNSKD